MDQSIADLVQALHDAPNRLVLVTAGAGTQSLAWVLGVAGASRTLIEALVPYDSAAFDDFLGQTPAQYVAPQTALLMAGRAYTRGRWLRPDAPDVIGLVCTATIVTDRPKRGEHRAHIATWQAERVIRYELHLEKGARDRAGEEETVSRVMINALARAAGLPARVAVPMGDGDNLEEVCYDLAAEARRLHAGEQEFFGIQADGVLVHHLDEPAAMLSGAFNPLHDGHLGLARAVEKQTGRTTWFELAAVNVDKPPLAPPAILRRMSQFAGRWPVLASRAPTYVSKACLYPGAIFVVGFDTAVRILHPRYYDDSQAQMTAALDKIREQGCRFLVAGRIDDEGNYREASQLEPPDGYGDLFAPLPGFRHDISSTELRRTGRRGSR